MNTNYYDKIFETVHYIQSKIDKVPEIAMVLGSGLGELTERVNNPIVMDYKDIVNFPQSTIKGHKGQLVIGEYCDKQVLMMNGRFHYYEGYSMKDIAFPIYVMKFLGVKKLIITNSCGAINPEIQPGDLVLIDDFISLVSDNPLFGINDDRLGPRFVDMTQPYSQEIKDKFHSAAKSLNINLREGVYGFFQGPYYETRAEIRAFGQMGCDLIGMSSVPETIAANHCGLEVAAISCVTNMATGLQDKKHSHEHVVEIANRVSKTLILLIEKMISL